jgi:hypothetical protein
MASMPASVQRKPALWRGFASTASVSLWIARGLETAAWPVLTILLASWQVTLRSDDESGVVRTMTQTLFGGRGGDLSQYRPLSYAVIVGLQRLLGFGPDDLRPYVLMRFVQCLLIFGLAYILYGHLGLRPRTRLLAIGLLAGIISLSLGPLGPSTFSLDRFTDTIFYLIAALLVVYGRDVLIPPLMVLAVANRETSVFIPMLLLARHGFRKRQAMVIALVAWVIAAVVYIAIHEYYGPRPRTEESYWGTAMVLHSLGMPAQVPFFFATVGLLPLLAVAALKDADPFLRRLFWLVVPVWFALHIWAARLGEGMLYLAPLTLIIVPLVLQGLERRLAPAPVAHPAT